MTAHDAAPGPCPAPRVVVRFGAESHVRCGRRSCTSCGVLWLHDTRIRTLAGVQAHGAPVALVTVTAPGVAVLPWDETGRLVDAEAAKAWNDDAPANWSQLHRAAARPARALAREWGAEWRLLVKSWEYQKRGVLHLHLLVPVASRGEYLASERYVRELAHLAEAHGFGFVDRGKLQDGGGRRSTRRLAPVDAHRAAAYVSGYLASTGAGKGGVAEVARAQGVPGAVVYVAQALTSRSGVTMRSLRDRRRVACRFPVDGTDADAWEAACLIDALGRGLPPMTAEHRGALMQRALAEGWTHVVIVPTGEVRGPTPAPAPGHACRDRAERSRAPRRSHFRLDSVLHGCHDTGPRWVTTATEVVDRPTFDSNQGEHRPRHCDRHRVAASDCACVPSDAPASVRACPIQTASPS